MGAPTRGGLRRVGTAVAGSFLLVVLVAACGGTTGTGSSGRPSIVVTTPELGSILRPIVGDQADVHVLMPRGADPHEWAPSAKDIARLSRADLIVRNGLDLEGGLTNALDRAHSDGVPTFVASDHIRVRHVRAGQGIPSGDPDQAVGAADPHLWTDPLTMRGVVGALGQRLTTMGLRVASNTRREEQALTRLDTRVERILSVVPEADRKLVTGHESLGYFADRYRFDLVGAVIPSLSTQAQTSAADLVTLKKQIDRERPKAIFTEIGTPSHAVEALGEQTGVKVVPLATEVFPADGSYDTYMTELATTIANALR